MQADLKIIDLVKSSLLFFLKSRSNNVLDKCIYIFIIYLFQDAFTESIIIN